MRTCQRCKADKPVEQFHRCARRKDGLQAWCKSCMSSYNNEKWPQHRRRHGLTDEQYQAKLEAQGNGCAICGKEREAKRRLAVDHDHETGTVRDLLCDNCNKGLGCFMDDPKLLELAAAYLVRHGRG